MKIEVSNGEILDKFSILEIKKKRISDPAKLKHILQEFAELERIVTRILSIDHPLYQKLLQTNETLWQIEDDIRVCERHQNFNDRFIELARAVYQVNDARADIKKQINLLTHSKLVEEKSYEALS